MAHKVVVLVSAQCHCYSNVTEYDYNRVDEVVWDQPSSLIEIWEVKGKNVGMASLVTPVTERRVRAVFCFRTRILAHHDMTRDLSEAPSLTLPLTAK
ncbi:MAG: hypothetical protein Q9198_001571, partial [Flavoplaca austrocitrina]